MDYTLSTCINRKYLPDGWFPIAMTAKNVSKSDFDIMGRFFLPQVFSWSERITLLYFLLVNHSSYTGTSQILRTRPSVFNLGIFSVPKKFKHRPQIPVRRKNGSHKYLSWWFSEWNQVPYSKLLTILLCWSHKTEGNQEKNLPTPMHY